MRSRAGLTSVILLAIMQLTLAWSIDNADWVPGLWILTPIVLGGVAVGALLSRWHWMPVMVAHGWSIVFGAATTFFLAAQTLGQYEFVDAAWLRDASLWDRLAFVRDWYVGWLSVAGSGPPRVGTLSAEMATLFAAVTLGLLLWLLSYISTWFAVRYISWPGAVLPSGFALVFNLVTQGSDDYAVYLGVFLLSGFLLAARMHLASRVARWQDARIGHSSDLEFNFLRDGLIVSVAVIALGMAMPESVRAELLSELPRTWAEMSDRAEDFSGTYFPSLNYPSRGGGNEFGNMMPLTGAIELGDEPVFDARLEDPNTPAAPRYWRMAIFDTWDGTGWQRTVESVERGEGLDLAPDWRLTEPVTQTIRTLKPETRQLYAAPQPDSFGIPVRAEVAGDRQDVLSVSSVDPLPINETYEAVSLLSVADGASLREADSLPDPQWVIDRYLAVPESLPQRVRDLAADVTRDAGTRYDAARAIEQYLRVQMTYDEAIPNPPEGRDKVDWFLFDLQRGYCDYYSSSFVMMARSLGIPARIAAGYSGGQTEEPGVYRLWDYDAHTWPEVFFPRAGWIEFEPTAGEPPLDRPEDVDGGEAGDDIPPPDREDPLMEDPLTDDPMEPSDRPSQLPDDGPQRAASGWNLPLMPMLGALALLGLLWVAAVVAWRRPLRGLTVAERAFARLTRVAGWLGLRPDVSETPHEYGRRLGGSIPDARGEISTITDAFVQERFGRRAIDGVGPTLEAAWSRTRSVLLRGAARLGIGRLRGRR